MTFHWKVVEQYFTVVLFVFQFYSVSNFGTDDPSRSNGCNFFGEQLPNGTPFENGKPLVNVFL